MTGFTDTMPAPAMRSAIIACAGALAGALRMERAATHHRRPSSLIVLPPRMAPEGRESYLRDALEAEVEQVTLVRCVHPGCDYRDTAAALAAIGITPLLMESTNQPLSEPIENARLRPAITYGAPID